ncbi:hypothetical protein GCM10020219_098290 [Nonomuraea dietziae]
MPEAVRVLVVEDERVLADAIATGLRREAMAVDVAYDGGTALEKTSYIDYDVIVLDRDLPVVHGDEVARRLVSERSASRILMLTAAGDVDDKVEGLGPSAPTTTWPSRSSSSSWSPGCGRWAAGRLPRCRPCWRGRACGSTPASGWWSATARRSC